jgi:hypothetical protein
MHMEVLFQRGKPLFSQEEEHDESRVKRRREANDEIVVAKPFKEQRLSVESASKKSSSCYSSPYAETPKSFGSSLDNDYTPLSMFEEPSRDILVILDQNQTQVAILTDEITFGRDLTNAICLRIKT